MLALVLAIAWEVIGPAYTLHRMQTAARAGDDRALADYIDFPALREDLKSELTAQLAVEARRDTSGASQLGLLLGTRLIEPLVDGLVSPAGLRAAFAAAPARPQPKAGPASPVRLPPQPTIRRRGLGEFAVGSPDDPRFGLVFRRRGLGWRLAGIDLAPLSAPPA